MATQSTFLTSCYLGAPASVVCTNFRARNAAEGVFLWGFVQLQMNNSSSG